MEFAIQHLTSYTYSESVELEPHTFKLRPRSDAAQQLLDFEMNVDPRPAGFSDGIDLEGNPFRLCWFSGATDHLRVSSHARVRTMRVNPYDFLLEGSVGRLPLIYSARQKNLTDVYAIAYRDAAAGHGSRVRPFAEAVARDANQDTVAFLSLLCERIAQACRVVKRADGDPWTGDKTLAEGSGACRDLAVLFCECCAAEGIAARFVSGYCYDESPFGSNELHAWAEAYLPGAGWRGFDPSRSLAVADKHVVLAASADSRAAAAVQGSFRSSAAASRFSFRLVMRRTADDR